MRVFAAVAVAAAVILAAAPARASDHVIELTYAAPAGAVQGEPSIAIGDVTDGREHDRIWLGAIRGGFGNPVKVLYTRGPVCNAVGAAVRAIVKAQKALRADPSLARAVGRRKFPADAAELIGNVVARDVEFYDPAIGEAAIEKMNRFAQSVGHLSRLVRYEDVVAVRYRDLWTA